jgi:hypothetical protein
MKDLKMLNLAAVAVMALMAIGASTASATKLCEENIETGCATRHVGVDPLLHNRGHHDLDKCLRRGCGGM